MFEKPHPLRVSTWACLVLAFLGAFTLSAGADYTRINRDDPEDSMHVHIYRLDNGLTVYLSENHETPRFYAEISVRAGSKHDPSDSTGLAHYLEHLLFKGNQTMGTLDYEKEKPYLDKITELYETHFKEEDPEKRKSIYAEINGLGQEASQYAIANEIDKLYNAMGGTGINAYTSNEQTVYLESLPANRLRQWAAIESARFTDPVFRLFHTELETVYEEKNRTLDNKSWIIHEAVQRTLFKVHPYGQQSTIGTVEHLKRPSLVHIRNYFNSYYVPNNMAIGMSGDIDIDAAIEIIDEYFSEWNAGELPAPKTWDEPPLEGVERVDVNFRGEEYVQLAFRTAPQGHEDVAALKLLDMILDNATAGLINLNLNQRQRVRGAGSSPDFMNDYGLQTLWGIPKEGQTLEEVEGLLIEQIDLIKKGAFDDWILEAIVNDFKKNEKARLESDRARVSAMTSAFVGYVDWEYAIGELGRLDRVAKEDVVAAANRYFGGDYVAGYRHDAQHDVPAIEKPLIDAVEIDPTRQSEFAKNILAMDYTEIEPVYVDPENDYTIVDYADGVKLYYAPNPLNDLFSFSISVEFGRRENNKIAIATRLLDKSGAGEFSPEDLKKEWYRLGTNFSIAAGDNESRMAIAGLDENFDESLALMMEVVNGSKAGEAVLEELKKIILVQREDAKKDPGAIGAALTNFNRYGKESSFLRVLPKEDLLELTVDELLAIVRSLLTYKQTITYTGSLPLEDVLKILTARHPITLELNEPPPYRYLYARAIDKTEIYFFDKEMAQAQVRIEFPNGKVRERDDTAIQLYNNYFAGGMSGIVFQELREARGLAYSAAARYVTGARKKAENFGVGVIGCQADKTPEALAAFLDLFDNLPESSERFSEAADAIVNRYRTSKIGFRGVIGAVRSWERLGLKGDPRRKRFERILSADLESMLKFHRTRIQGQPRLISVVGDKVRIDMDELAKLGTVWDIGLKDIFVD